MSNQMMKQRGFTLVELLVAIFMALMIMAAGYVIFFGSSRGSAMETQVSKMQDNARMAMDALSRNFRMAAFLVNFSNYPAGTVISSSTGSTFASTIIHADNAGPVGQDQVTLVFGGASPAWSTSLRNTAPTGSNQIILKDVSGIVPGCVIGIGLAHTAVVSGVDPLTNTVILDTTNRNEYLNMTYPGQYLADGTSPSNQQPAQVVLLRATTFYIANDPATGKPVLYQDGAPLAEDIEDLQIAYGVDINNDKVIQANEWTNTPTAVNVGGVSVDMTNKIRLVRITVVARTGQEDPALKGTPRTLQTVENSPYSGKTVTDGYRRFYITRVIKCRNMDVLPVL